MRPDWNEDAAKLAEDVVVSLGSQNQALQERAEKAEKERDEFRELLLDKGMKVGNAETARLGAENQALQERIEEVAGYVVQLRPLSHEQALILPKLLQLLSPTQETDEPDCTRCGNERTVGGYGTDERFPCPVCRPDPIRCQSRCDQWPNCQHDWRSWHNRPTQETSEPDRILSAAGAATEPERVLIAAGVEALRPFVRSLRKMGWAAGITAHSDPLKVTLDIDLTGLKRLTQETDPE